MKAWTSTYSMRHARSSNVVVIEPDLTKAFPNSRAVNAALRQLLRIQKGRNATTRRSKSR